MLLSTLFRDYFVSYIQWYKFRPNFATLTCDGNFTRPVGRSFQDDSFSLFQRVNVRVWIHSECLSEMVKCLSKNMLEGVFLGTWHTRKTEGR